MLNRRFVIALSVVSVIILGTGYFTTRFLSQDLLAHLQTETNRLAYARVLLSTRILGESVLKNDHEEIKRVLEGLSDDSEIACVQYRDGSTLISSQDENRPCQSTGDQGLFSMTLSEEPNERKKVLEIVVRGDYSKRMSERIRYPFLILSAEFLLALILVFLYFLLSNRALSEFLVSSFRRLAQGDTVESPRSILLEAKPIEKSVREIEQNMDGYRRVMSERVEGEILVKVAAQVSHDVKAPLGAMEMVIGSLSIEGEKREILKSAMKRIREISDSLLSKQKQIKNFVSSEAVASSEPITEISIVDSVDEIVREKRVTLPSGVLLEWNPTFHAKVFAQSIEWKRVFSNLLNNAIEAMEGRAGVVQIAQSVSDHQYEMMIVDTGKGIEPQDLKRLGEFGYTVGKSEGKGIGLHHAMKAIRAWGGDLIIESEVGSGTRISLKLKLAELILSWKKNKVLALGLTRVQIEEIHGQCELLGTFDSITEFRKYYGANFADLDEVIFLVSHSHDSWIQSLKDLGLVTQMRLL